MSAITELVERLRTGKLTCIGPKHFPAEEWKGKNRWAGRIAAELRGKVSIAQIAALVRRLEAISRKYPDWDTLAASGEEFLNLLRELKPVRLRRICLRHREARKRLHPMSVAFHKLLTELLTVKEGHKRIARIRKTPQLENITAFLTEIQCQI